MIKYCSLDLFLQDICDLTSCSITACMCLIYKYHFSKYLYKYSAEIVSVLCLHE